MGIETIFIIVGVIAVIAIVVAATKSKRRLHDQQHPTATTRPPGDPEPPDIH